MTKKRIRTKGKSYAINQSALFGIGYEKGLFTVLGIEKGILFKSNENYRFFKEHGRKIQEPTGQRYYIHNTIASLLSRLEFPSYVHSGRKNHSYVTNALAHQKTDICLTMDIQSFFTSVSTEHVFKFFRNQMQCSHAIANLLADICTVNGHLPTGSQVSMPLAYWANSKMFDEIQKLAAARGLVFTIYVDDITFSGTTIHKNFAVQVSNILQRYGYTTKKSKTRLYTKGKAREITGLIIKNGKVSLPSRHYKKLNENLRQWEKHPSENLYNKTKGLLHFIREFDPGYSNVLDSFIATKNNKIPI